MNRFAPTKRMAGTALACFMTSSANAAAAEPEPQPRQVEVAVAIPDVVIHDTPQPHRLVAIEWNPLPLPTIRKASANVIITPADHHALVLSPFYVSTTTESIDVVDDSGRHTRLPEQKFYGFGAELGYRYYGGSGGPRGLFVGPSLVLGSFTAKAQDGTKTPYLDLGIAADVGYQVLVADRVALSLGGGIQYVAPSKSIPAQQFPASVYANSRVSPRLLFAVGWAL